MTPLCPQPDSLTAFFWEATRIGQLHILRCRSCGFYIHWPKPVCPICLSFDLAPSRVSGEAKLYSYTESMKSFHPSFERLTPYVLAAVDLCEQDSLRLLTRVSGCAYDDLAIDMPMIVDFVPLTSEITLPLFRPALGAENG